MSLDVYLTRTQPTEVYAGNITHNLAPMAREAGIYQHLWRPEELKITKAHKLIKPLGTGYDLLISDPERFKKLDAVNGWGLYVHLVAFVRKYLSACIEFPDADIEVKTDENQVLYTGAGRNHLH
jgi:hypothetical protein